MLGGVNGIQLWADLNCKRAYFGILPLADWQDVAKAGWAIMFETPPDGLLVMSYHDNGQLFRIGYEWPNYFWYDLEDFNNPVNIGATIPALLDRWWKETDWLDPRHDQETSAHRP